METCSSTKLVLRITVLTGTILRSNGRLLILLWYERARHYLGAQPLRCWKSSPNLPGGGWDGIGHALSGPLGCCLQSGGCGFCPVLSLSFPVVAVPRLDPIRDPSTLRPAYRAGSRERPYFLGFSFLGVLPYIKYMYLVQRQYSVVRLYAKKLAGARAARNSWRPCSQPRL